MDHLSEYMRGRCEEEDQRPGKNTLVQTYRGKDLFLFSELLQFYLEMGYEVRNVRLAVQYLGQQCLAPFIEKVTKMRIDATREGDETRANTAKILGNSSYGKLLQNPAKYTSTKLVGEKKIGKYARKLRLQSCDALETEKGELPYHEVVLTKARVEDSFPIHIGDAVLQHSKLHFLRFVYCVLHKFVVPNSIRLVYCVEFVALACKSYYISDSDGNVKRSSKGIPHSIDLELDQFRDVLFGGVRSHKVDIQCLRVTRDKKMARLNINKRGLNDIFCKMHVASDKVTCTPLTLNGEFL